MEHITANIYMQQVALENGRNVIFYQNEIARERAF